MFLGLGGYVVIVDQVTNGMDTGEEKCCAGTNLVELEMGIERNILVEGVLFEFGDKILTNREE